jgi:F-type H+-transporting ATPase subunit epsilon
MHFHLLTPTHQLASLHNATAISVAGEAGDFGVLPGHMPLVSTIRPGGTVSVTAEDGTTQTFTVTLGVAEVTPQGVTILAQHAEVQA